MKRSKDTPLGYKSYRGTQYTKTRFEILGRTKKAPYRYKIKLKGKYVWKTRDSLLRTYTYDEKTSKYLSRIKGADERAKEKEKLDKIAKEIEEERAKKKKQNQGRRHKPNKMVWPLFYDPDTKKKFRIKNMVQLEKLRK